MSPVLFPTHHCSLYHKVGWTSLQSRRNKQLPNYLTSLLSYKSSNYSNDPVTTQPQIPFMFALMLTDVVSGTMHLINGVNCKLSSNLILMFLSKILQLYYLLFFYDSRNFFLLIPCLLCSCVVSVCSLCSCHECFLFSGFSWKRDF